MDVILEGLHAEVDAPSLFASTRVDRRPWRRNSLKLRTYVFLLSAAILIPVVAVLAWALAGAHVAGPAPRAAFAVFLSLVAAFAAAGAIAFFVARRLARAIADAAEAAAALGRGDIPAVESSAVAEVSALNAAIGGSGAILMRQHDAREHADAERARALAAEASARRLAESQNQAKDEVLALLADELRNPLDPSSAAAAVIGRAGATPEAVALAREAVARQAEHLVGIVDDLLDLSGVMKGNILLDRQRVDLGEAARRCVASLRNAGRLGSHAVALRTEPAWVDADAARLDQIITNLLTNAVKYGGENGDIDVEVAVDAAHAVLSVRDAGIGISEALLPHVFDIFVQGAAAPDRGKGGLGVGLSLVRRLAILHGATVTAASPGPGRGSTFTVRFPRVPAPEIPAPAPAPSAAAMQAGRVLVVDDHHDGRRMLSVMLNLFGYQCLEAHDGADGLRAAAAEQPDVAIIDIGLPGIDGYEVARRLRADPQTRKIGLIALTGHGQEDDRRRALEAGFDMHLVKPVNPDLLNEAVEEAVRRGH